MGLGADVLRMRMVFEYAQNGSGRRHGSGTDFPIRIMTARVACVRVGMGFCRSVIRVRTPLVFCRGQGTYTQGQSPEPRVREYFYYLDHQGQLFLDDTKVKNFVTCFKDQHFLVFFFKHLKVNRSDRYQHCFPFLSLCGRERNFLRCDDKPVVFTNVVSETGHGPRLSYCGGGTKLTFPFQPHSLFMHPDSGRVYHPAPELVGGVGLVRSALAIEFSSHFQYTSGQDSSAQPTHFLWAGQRYTLTNELLKHFALK